MGNARCFIVERCINGKSRKSSQPPEIRMGTIYRKCGFVFMLWGNHAFKKGKNIDRTKHLVLTSGHPSPMSANQGKWFGNRHFSQANNYLMQQEKTPINWQLGY